MNVFFKTLRIKNGPISVIGCVILDLFGIWLGAKGWMLGLIEIPLLKILSITTPILFFYFFINICVDLFKIKNTIPKDSTSKIILGMLFMLQILLALGIHLNLLFLGFGLY